MFKYRFNLLKSEKHIDYPIIEDVKFFHLIC